MKVSTLLIAGSIALNAILGAILIAGRAGSADAAARPMPAPGAAAVATAPTSPATWDALRSEDLRVERDRLLAEGLTRKQVRIILAAQIHESFAARRKALEAGQANLPFWKSAQGDPKSRAALREIAREEQKAIKDLLGPDTESRTIASLRRQVPEFSGDKIEQLAAVTDSYNERRADFYATSSGMVPGDREKLAALDRDMRAEIAALLTPAELEDYNLRTSSTANNMRYNLSAFDPSEQEFRAIFQLQSAFDEQYATNGAPLTIGAQARNAAQQKLKDDIAAALGPDRYAEYQRSSDYSYRQSVQLMSRLGLPADTANQLYSLRTDTQARATAIRQGGAAGDDVRSQLAALTAEPQARVGVLLPPNAIEAYRQNGGQWLQNLSVRPAIPGPK